MINKFIKIWNSLRLYAIGAAMAALAVSQIHSHVVDIHVESPEEHDAHERDAAAFDSRGGNDTYYHDEGTPPAGDPNHHYHDGKEVFDA